jgi:hypothetical protein
MKLRMIWAYCSFGGAIGGYVTISNPHLVVDHGIILYSYNYSFVMAKMGI